MKFELDEDMQSAQDLAAEVFTSLAAVERVRDVERGLGGFDEKLWAALAETGLLGIAVPEEHGGSGLGVVGLVTILEEQGRRVAPVPFAAAVATAVLPLISHGTQAQREQWVPAFLDGSAIIVGAVGAAVEGDLAVRGERDGDGWRINGSLIAVAGGSVAAALLVPISTPDGVIAAVIPTDRAGLGRESVAVTNHGATAAVTFTDVRVDAADLLTGGDAAIAQARQLGRIAFAAIQSGVAAEALAMTAKYTSERIQFDRPLSTNQAVATRAADAHVDAERIMLTTRWAAWLVDQGRSDADSASLVASWWAARGGLRVVHATQHLHGGMGADIEYPIHRYFLWGRQVAFSLGSAAALEAELGAMIESVPLIGASA